MGRKLEEFKPIKEGFVGFYGCGPTVYNYAHIGNLRAYVFLDTLDRTLTFLGYDIKHVMNITDVGHLTGDGDEGDDKMVKTAEERHQSVLEVAKFYTDAFMNDIASLNIRQPDVICNATDHIPDMIALIKKFELHQYDNQVIAAKGGDIPSSNTQVATVSTPKKEAPNAENASILFSFLHFRPPKPAPTLGNILIDSNTIDESRKIIQYFL